MLTDAEYQEIITHRNTLQLQIDAAKADKEHYDDMKVEVQAVKDAFQERMALYDNYLSDAIAEYEAAHPPEV